MKDRRSRKRVAVARKKNIVLRTQSIALPGGLNSLSVVSDIASLVIESGRIHTFSQGPRLALNSIRDRLCSLTKVPLPATAVTAPIACKSRKARFMVIWLTPNSLPNVAADGIGRPSGYVPFCMRFRTSLRTASCKEEAHTCGVIMNVLQQLPVLIKLEESLGG